MTNFNFNGQNGVATSANVNVVDFSNVSLTNTLVENFAKEITENLSRINSKGGCPLANFTFNAKGGKVTQISEGVEKLSVTWYMLTPYCLENKKHRHEIIIENGIVRAGSVRNLLVGVLNYMSYVQECFNDIKKYGVESSCVAIDFATYPLLKSTHENYGEAEMDRRFAEFSEYLASLDMDSSVAVVEQEISNAPSLDDDEYDTLGTGAIEMFNAYMRERVSEEFESLVDALKDSADEFMGEEVSCEFIYEFDYEQEWLDYITNMDDINVTSEYALDFYKEYIGWFINADDMLEYIYSIEEGCGAWTEDHGCECCNVYVENPYYVSDKMRANRIAKIVNDNWVKNAVEESVKLDWSLFNEQDMELMFSDNDFAKMVYDRVCESNKYFSECLAYDDCFYVWLTENVSCILVDYIYDLDSRPAWVNRNDFDFKDGGDYLDFVMSGRYHIGLYYDPSDSSADFACAENGGAYGKRDMEYAVEIMDNRDMILALAKKARIVKPSVEEIIESALDEAMESDDEYYDDVICQIGKWYVNYTSPCDEFPDGCVLVVDERGCMYGNWCDVSDVDFAVEYLVNTIEKCNKEFNNVA